MIPKKIHYIWMGGAPKNNLVNICIRSWKEKMPDYEIIEWNESNINIEEICTQNKFFYECKKRKLWAFMADYLRLKILYENGGFYFDTDVQAIKNMDDFLSNDYVIGMENKNEVSSAVIGSEKNNPLIKKLLDFYTDRIWSENIYIITQIMTKVVKEQNEEIKIYPKFYFSPIEYEEDFKESCINENTYTIHWFNNSWNKKIGVYTFLQTKHIKNPILRLLMKLKRFLNFIIER